MSLNDEIADMDEAYEDNMGFLDEMGGERFSNNKAMVSRPDEDWALRGVTCNPRFDP